MTDLTLTTARHASRSVVTVVGELDLMSADQLIGSGLSSLADPEVVELEVDLAGVTFFGSHGINALVELRNSAAARTKGFRVVKIPPRVVALLAATGLDRSVLTET
jgi:anti-anti-sigma factor